MRDYAYGAGAGAIGGQIPRSDVVTPAGVATSLKSAQEREQDGGVQQELRALAEAAESLDMALCEILRAINPGSVARRI